MTALFFFNSICQEMGFHEKICVNYADIDRSFVKYSAKQKDPGIGNIMLRRRLPLVLKASNSLACE